MGRTRVAEAGGAPLLPEPVHARGPLRRLCLPRQDPAQDRSRGTRRPPGSSGYDPLRRPRRARMRRHAWLRQHRSARRNGLDGGHLGHGRFLRPDRARRAPVGRCRDRRGARAARSASGDHRGRRLHRQPKHRRRGGDRGQRGRARRRCDPHRLDTGHRRHGTRGSDPQRDRPSSVGGDPRRSTQDLPSRNLPPAVRPDHRAAIREHRPKDKPESGSSRVPRSRLRSGSESIGGSFVHGFDKEL